MSRVIALIGSTSSFILMPYFSDLFRKNKVDEVKVIYKEIRVINTSLTFPILACILIYSEKILAYISDDYMQYSLILIVISIGAIFPIIFGPNGTVILMTKSFKKEINSGLILISTFLLFSLLFGSLNILVVPLAFASAEILASLYKVLVVKKILGFSFDYKYYLKLLFLLTVNLWLCYSVAHIESYLLSYLLSGLVLFVSIAVNMVVLSDRKNIEKYRTAVYDFRNSFKL